MMNKNIETNPFENESNIGDLCTNAENINPHPMNVGESGEVHFVPKQGHPIKGFIPYFKREVSKYDGDEKLKSIPMILLTKIDMKSLPLKNSLSDTKVKFVKVDNKANIKQTMDEIIIPLSTFRYMEQVESQENLGLSEIPVQAFVGHQLIDWVANYYPKMRQCKIDILQNVQLVGPTAVSHQIKITNNNLPIESFNNNLKKCKKSKKRPHDLMENNNNLPEKLCKENLNGLESIKKRPKLDNEFDNVVHIEKNNLNDMLIPNLSNFENSILDIQHSSPIALQKITDTTSLKQLQPNGSGDFLRTPTALNTSTETNSSINSVINNKKPRKYVNTGTQTDISNMHYKYAKVKLRRSFGAKRKKWTKLEIIRLNKVTSKHRLFKDSKLVDLESINLDISTPKQIGRTENLSDINTDIELKDQSSDFFFKVPTSFELNAQTSLNFEVKRPPTRPSKSETIIPQTSRTNKEDDTISLYAESVYDSPLDELKECTNAATNDDNFNDDNIFDYNYSFYDMINSPDTETDINTQSTVTEKRNIIPEFGPVMNGKTTSPNVSAQSFIETPHQQFLYNSLNLDNSNVQILSNELVIPNQSITPRTYQNSNWNSVDHFGNRLPSSTHTNKRVESQTSNENVFSYVDWLFRVVLCHSFTKTGWCRNKRNCNKDHRIHNLISLVQNNKDALIYFFKSYIPCNLALVKKFIDIFISNFEKWKLNDCLIDLGLLLIKNKPIYNWLQKLRTIVLRLCSISGTRAAIEHFLSILNYDGPRNYLHIHDLFLDILLKSDEKIEDNWNLIKELTRDDSYEISIEHLEILLKNSLKESCSKDSLYSLYVIVSRLAPVNLKKAEKTFSLDIRNLIIKMFSCSLANEANDLTNRLNGIKSEPEMSLSQSPQAVSYQATEFFNYPQ